MRPSFFFALGCLVALARGAERDEKHAFAVEPGCTLRVDSYRGSVIVTESDTPAIVVAVHMEIGGDTEEEGERLRAGLQLDVKQTGNTVAVFARNPAETRMRWVWREDRQIDLTYRITVPRRCDIDAKLVKGSVTVGELQGRMTARVEDGGVFCRRIAGSVDAAVEHGTIVVSRCLGDVTARTHDGLIRTGTITGAANLQNASGDVEILQAHGAVTATAEAGNVIAGFPRHIGGDVHLTSRGGNVLAKIDPAASCRIAASSTWGEVRGRLPLIVEAGALGRKHLTARLHNGGPTLTLRASGGDVRLDPGETLFE